MAVLYAVVKRLAKKRTIFAKKTFFRHNLSSQIFQIYSQGESTICLYSNELRKCVETQSIIVIFVISILCSVVDRGWKTVCSAFRRGLAQRRYSSRLGVLETWVLVSRSLETGFYKSWSRSWSWNPQVSVSVLVLGLATMKTRFSSLMKREIVRLPPPLLWNGYLATVVCWCRQTELEWVTCCHSWSTCDATISCKFSCCCTVGISL